jgi:hypothetical protein
MTLTRTISIFVGIMMIITAVAYWLIMDTYIFKAYDVSLLHYSVLNVPTLWLTLTSLYLLFLYQEPRDSRGYNAYQCKSCV